MAETKSRGETSLNGDVVDTGGDRSIDVDPGRRGGRLSARDRGSRSQRKEELRTGVRGMKMKKKTQEKGTDVKSFVTDRGKKAAS